ncbi:MAG TPA: DNA-directed RNA polymerase subunit omega [Desulfobacterales bacterium]|nr:DNA-directed RNA polymerase subunit omega [Desulfobacterales bacterium]
MARITVEDCLKLIGSENRFALIHLAIARLKQHRQGMPFLVEGKNKEVVMTLREIAAGKVTPENLKSLEEAVRAEEEAARVAAAKSGTDDEPVEGASAVTEPAAEKVVSPSGSDA